MLNDQSLSLSNDEGLDEVVGRSRSTLDEAEEGPERNQWWNREDGIRLEDLPETL